MVSTRPLRILVEPKATEGGGWLFDISCPVDETFRISRPADRVSKDVPWPRAADTCCKECRHVLGPEELDDALKRLRRQGGHAVDVGHYLFSALFGGDWPKVLALAVKHDAKIVEVAFLWKPANSVLSALPWELLHEGEHYLGTSAASVMVTVTRVVAGTNQHMPELPAVPKVLFVIGASVTDESVRPGAEMLSLLREVEGAGRQIQHRVLDNATAKTLNGAMQAYRPDIVHFICHGGYSDQGGGYLMLRADEPDQPEEFSPYTADQILEWLRVETTRIPSIVMLSCCESAGSGPGESRLRASGGPELASPFAVDLLYGGVPVVLAMAGTISDRACRVFTRAFARALAAGEPLTVATAEARRSAFAEVPAQGSVDWALPAMFFAEQVDPSATGSPVDTRVTDLRRWVESLRLEHTPVFAAREKFFDAYWSILARAEGVPGGWERVHRPERPAVLAVCVDENVKGLGSTRLLEKFACAAFENGHIPLIVPIGKEEVPGDARLLARALGTAMLRLSRDALGLGKDQGSQLRLLGRERAEDEAELDDGVRDTLQNSTRLEAMKEALALDSAALLRAAESRFPGSFGQRSRVVLLLDKLGESSVALLQDLIATNLGLGWHGAGTKEFPIPVVLIVKYGAAGDFRRTLVETGIDEDWLEISELKAFDTSTEEDLLAYEHVLLHPFRSNDDDLRERWVFDRALPPEKWARCAKWFRDRMKGIPSNFHSENYESAVTGALNAEYLSSAKDQDDRKAVSQ
jgi:CHAT domain